MFNSPRRPRRANDRRRSKARRRPAPRFTRLLGERLEDRSLLAITSQLVKDITTTPVDLRVSGPMVEVAGFHYFAASLDGTDIELWRSDGTTAGTTLVKDIRPGGLSSGLSDLTNIGGTLYFHADDGVHGDELWVSNGTADGTTLARDIFPGPATSSVGHFSNLNGKLLFTANDGVHGFEPWIASGNSVQLLMDINTQFYGVRVQGPLVEMGGSVYFSGSFDGQDYELWRSDGTAAGTMLVKDIRPPTLNGANFSSNPINLTNVSGTLFFTANDGTHGNELWKSDGTANGTVLVKDINPGSGGSTATYFANANAYFTNVNGTLFFAANDGTSGIELWKSDGTPAGTALVKDILPGSAGSKPLDFAALNGSLLFRANDGVTGYELWRSDGTANGTMLVKDIFPGASSSNQAPYGSMKKGNIATVDGTLFFAANNGATGAELWKSDGTPGGTVLVKNVYDDSIGSPVGSYPTSLVNVGGTLFFAALNSYDPGNGGYFGRSVWRSDGTASGTTLVKGFGDGNGVYDTSPKFLTNVNGRLFFQALAPDGNFLQPHLWKSDGTPGGTTPFALMSVSIYGGPVVASLSGNFIFPAGGEGGGVWKTDGTAAGTVVLKRISGDVGATYLDSAVNVNGTLFFTSTDGTNGRELWKTDGTTAGTAKVPRDTVSTNSAWGVPLSSLGGASTPYAIQSFTIVGDVAYFVVNDGIHGLEPWRTDGTAAGTWMLKDVIPGPVGSSPSEVTNVNGSLYFAVSRTASLWKSNGTEAGTVLVKEIVDEISASGPRYLTNVNGTLFFAVSKWLEGTELWKSDGTADGTGIVKDIVPGQSNGSDPRDLFAFGDKLVFTATAIGTGGRELWVSDGSVAGTVMLKDIKPGIYGSGPANFHVLNGTIFFTADDGTAGRELWNLI